VNDGCDRAGNAIWRCQSAIGGYTGIYASGPIYGIVAYEFANVAAGVDSTMTSTTYTDTLATHTGDLVFFIVSNYHPVDFIHDPASFADNALYLSSWWNQDQVVPANAYSTDFNGYIETSAEWLIQGTTGAVSAGLTSVGPGTTSILGVSYQQTFPVGYLAVDNFGTFVYAMVSSVPQLIEVLDS
jgi:hypothetical protein